jgi:hypothetical protein
MNAQELIDQSKDLESKPGSKPDAKDDLKSLPMAEAEKKLGSSPDGLAQVEAAKRLTQYGPERAGRKEDQSAAEVPHLGDKYPTILVWRDGARSTKPPATSYRAGRKHDGR